MTIDRKVQLDLTGRREFTLDVEPGEMAAVGEVTLYFKSGNGWYGCGAGLRRAGPQTLRFAKLRSVARNIPPGGSTLTASASPCGGGSGENSFAPPQPPGSLGGPGEDYRAGRGGQVIDPAHEGRAFWNHSGTGAYPGDWERTAKALQAGGFNMILPNQLWAGRADYPSKLLPQSETFRKYGDQVAQCVAAAHRHGLQVHVWKVNFNLGNAPREFVEKLRREGRTQVSAGGKATNWLCPSHPENFKLEVDTMLEVARMYAVDGLHFDYIRYPGRRALLLRRLPQAVRGRQRQAGGQLARRLLSRPAAGRVSHLALPADHPRGRGRVARGEAGAAGDQDFSRRLRGLSELPPGGRAGLGGLGEGRLCRFPVPDGLYAPTTTRLPTWLPAR